VAVSRGSINAEIFTDSVEDLETRLGKGINKTAAINFGRIPSTHVDAVDSSLQNDVNRHRHRYRNLITAFAIYRVCPGSCREHVLPELLLPAQSRLLVQSPQPAWATHRLPLRVWATDCVIALIPPLYEYFAICHISPP
jgi:hypothetical protein